MKIREKSAIGLEFEKVLKENIVDINYFREQIEKNLKALHLISEATGIPFNLNNNDAVRSLLWGYEYGRTMYVPSTFSKKFADLTDVDLWSAKMATKYDINCHVVEWKQNGDIGYWIPSESC